ncbi:MYXO-CTERM sorting domain-containing protein [Nannocystis sp. SCPEA4]|uniref:MYXO-CTERM sorting domain-containing protein n=1 Tax=Nannocystis sp. SCPEA4 TaxID=2996787 RepID=UPI00226DA38A|nr:MYXO-CTERM sorting domain-containing protein [Nannocystis sp. SCPEA4]MCY1063071.1 MYXO-CTERM sorting domain-containing protein [Nannocystis sp. SCPEA4]
MPRLALVAPFALVLGLDLLLEATAHAGPVQFVEQRKNFMVFDDDGTVEHANWFSRTGFYGGYYPLEDGFLEVHPDDGQFIVVYSTFDLVDGVGAFYQSLANDVAGIGYSHAADFDPVIPAEFFDDTPNSQFIGMLHMNNWRKFILTGTTEIDDWWISLVFGQELGHAWLAFPHVAGGGNTELLLGRSQAHWNFYMHSGGSPVEGHRWTDNGDGTFTAPKLEQFEFSDLDLYLMGLMDPSEVKPWFVIEDPHDCVDSALPNQECPPASSFLFQADSFTVSGTRRDVTIDDVIMAEGEREPAYPDAPNEFGISFLLVKRPGEVLCEEEYALIDEIIDRSIAMWVGQTRGRASIINRTFSADPITPGVFCEAGTSTGDTDPTGDSTSSASDSGPVDPPTTGTAPTTDATSTSAGASSGDSDSDGSSGGVDTDAGCGCRSPGPPATPLALLLTLAAFRRRTRA